VTAIISSDRELFELMTAQGCSPSQARFLVEFRGTSRLADDHIAEWVGEPSP
jgi:hypothetical protein